MNINRNKSKNQLEDVKSIIMFREDLGNFISEITIDILNLNMNRVHNDSHTVFLVHRHSIGLVSQLVRLMVQRGQAFVLLTRMMHGNLKDTATHEVANDRKVLHSVERQMLGPLAEHVWRQGHLKLITVSPDLGHLDIIRIQIVHGLRHGLLRLTALGSLDHLEDPKTTKNMQDMLINRNLFHIKISGQVVTFTISFRDTRHFY